MLCTTYPQGKEFPFFTWAQLFFSGVDILLLGWFKSGGDFNKPASYRINDINRLIKPLPLPVISKVNDFLTKICNYYRQCPEGQKISLVWRGYDAVEIYERDPAYPCVISDGVRENLKTQVNEADA